MRTTPHRRGLYAPELLEARIAPATFIVRNLSDAAVDSLRNVIGQANATAETDTIVFDPVLFPNNLPGKITLSLEISILNPLTIKGPGVDLLTVSGNDLVRIFNIDYSVASLKPTTISGLTLTDGRAAQDGGAVISVEPLTLKNVVVRSSYAGNDGGGVFVNTPGKISISGSRIVHNQAINGGGGLYLRSLAGVSVIKTVIADNRADNGGGLYAQATGAKSVVLIDGCTISNNVALGDNGGGLQMRSVDDARLIVKNSFVSGNQAQTAGGGLYAVSGHLLISRTTFSNNNADRGGAIAADRVETFTISGSRFLGNEATNATAGNPGGGALYLQGPNTVLKIAGTVFAGNHSATYGGAIAHTGAMTMSVTGSTFLGNTAVFRGGAFDLSDDAVLTMSSSLISGNSSGDGGAFNLTGATLNLKSSTVSGNNAEGGGGGAIFAQPTSFLNLTGNKFTENHALYGGAIDMIGNMGGQAVTATLSGNLFQANVADNFGGAVATSGASVFTSKGDKFIGNVAVGPGGGVYLGNTAGTFITSSLFQGNVAGGGSGGGLNISGGGAILTGVKVLDNIAGPGGRGGGLRISDVNVLIFKSVITGNVANDGGGIVNTGGVTTLDAATRAALKGNSASINPNSAGV